MEIVNSENEIKIICGTEEERKKIPIILSKLQEVIKHGWGGIKVVIETKHNGTKHIFIRKWENIH